MRWATAVQKAQDAADEFARIRALPESFDVPRPTHVWAVGDLLGPAQPLEWITIAVSVDAPPELVPWWNADKSVRHLLNMTRLPKNPVRVWWRSSHLPVWNHRIVHPLLLWDEAQGVHADAFAAMHEGRGLEGGLPAPTPKDLTRALERDLAISLASMRECTSTFEKRRWGQGRLEQIADPLHDATSGYLDLYDAIAALADQAVTDLNEVASR